MDKQAQNFFSRIWKYAFRIVIFGPLLIFLVWLLLFAYTNKPAPLYIKDEAYQKSLKSHYIIELGSDKFRIPVEYILDSRQRRDGSDNYVVLMAELPNLTPLENATHYNRLPPQESNTIIFSLSHVKIGESIAENRLQYHTTHQKDVFIPDYGREDGLVFAGVYKLAGKDNKRSDVYAYIKSRKPISVIECMRFPDYPNPFCKATINYLDHVSIDPDFKVENLDWYTRENGISKIINRVDGWRIKDSSKKNIQQQE